MRWLDPHFIASGHSEHELGRWFGASSPDGFLQKPYSVDTLVGKVWKAVERSRWMTAWESDGFVVRSDI